MKNPIITLLCVCLAGCAVVFMGLTVGWLIHREIGFLTAVAHTVVAWLVASVALAFIQDDG